MYDLNQLADEAVLHGFAQLVAHDRRLTAALLAHIAEIDARHLYLREGHESMRAYCMARLHLTEDAAAKRIQVARLARQMPQLFKAIADGRLSLYGVRLLAPWLTLANVDELIERAANKSAPQIERVIAIAFPQPEVLRLDDGISPHPEEDSHAARHASSEPVVAPKVRTKIKPLSEDRYKLEVSLTAAAHDRLRRAQSLLGHAVPSGDVGEVLDRALIVLVAKLEKRKFGVGRTSPRAPKNVRTIPARVKRAVYERDGGRCVATLADGTRCNSIQKLEFDHIVPVARGGRSTVDNLRSVCRAHNQAAAEQAFGREFMVAARGRR